jgi:TetR/AcrR family transcriptional regulator
VASVGLALADEVPALADKLKPGPGKSPAAVGLHQRARVQGAMIEIVAEQGYEAVTVREIARRAGVSTRAFYRHYSGKEECFLRTLHLVSMRFMQRLEAVGAAADFLEEPMRAAVGGILDEWDRDPAAARLMLVEAHAFGGPALTEARRMRRSIECMLERAFACLPEKPPPDPYSVTGIAAGIAGVVRPRLRDERVEPLAGLAGPLTRWALAHRGSSMAQLGRRGGIEAPSQASFQPAPSSNTDTENARALDGDLALLFSAAARLSASESREQITPRKIALMAGLPRHSFENRFACVDDCLEALLQSHADEVMEAARRAGEAGGTRAGVVYRAVAGLCDRVARDRTFATLCFDETVAPGEWRIRCHEHLIDELRAVVEGATVARDDRLGAEASAAALCGVLQEEFARGRAARLPEVAPMLAYMLLAPAVGGAEATFPIRNEQGRAM